MSDFLIIDGATALQTPKTPIVFKQIIHEFDAIVEIGFNQGGFSKWLFDNKNINTKLICYDITFIFKKINNNDIDFRLGNCFDTKIIEEIIDIIKNSDKVLILCDGAYKEKEFQLYAKHIKSGDVIMLHDYADSNADFMNITKAIKWHAKSESSFANIYQSIIDNNLIPYYYNELKSVLWGAFKKV
jgi:23S rRNA U2552 (ribose-2'-O)-methylase RlmE/FtsJ